MEYFFIFEHAFAKHNAAYRHVSKGNKKNVGNKNDVRAMQRNKKMKNIYVMPMVKEHANNKTVYVEIMQRK